MAYLKVEYGTHSFILDPHILRLVIPEIYRQLPQLTIYEIADYLKAFGFEDIKESIPVSIRQILEENTEKIDDQALRVEESITWRNPRFWAEQFFHQCSEEARVKRHTKASKSLKTLDKALHNPYFKELLFQILARHGFSVTESHLTQELREIIRGGKADD